MILSVMNKFLKRVTLLFSKDTYTAVNWTDIFLKELMNWRVLVTIISDCNRKFLSEFWISLFKRLNIKLLYFTAHHLQTDNQSKCSNQTAEIVLQYYITDNYKNRWNWVFFLLYLHAILSNSKNWSTDKSSNEVIYRFNLQKCIQLIETSSVSNEIADTQQIN